MRSFGHRRAFLSTLNRRRPSSLGRVCLAALALVASMLLGACPTRVPETHYYQLATPACRATGPGAATLAVGHIEIASGYGGDRIVYREARYALSRYEYHRWNAPPEELVADFLQRGLEATGLFSRITREPFVDEALVLEGRIRAFEEVNLTETDWIGHVELELSLRDPETGELAWSRRYREIEPLAVRSPAGLAGALSEGMSRIVGASAPEIAARAEAYRWETPLAAAGERRVHCEIPPAGS